ncbi:MAG: 3-phosphoshikimate 1-carboxyvinyltransferase [Candidatus Fermentibacteria bacterium]|nr:3-phosphoshikimate 1-carboxyvinyltransferase [Candidatus Fermentibacteria bacterium]
MNDLKMHIPGSKYIANRVLLISALTHGKSVISNVPGNQDMELLLESLSSIGVCFHTLEGRNHGQKKLEVWGIRSSCCNLNTERRIDVGESGTLLRFVTGLACLLHGKTDITAGSRNKERPIEPLIQALNDLGALVTAAAGRSLYPIMIQKRLLGGGTVLAGDISSQFISSLLIVSPYAEKDVEIKVLKPIVSSGYIDMTIREMERFGVTAKRNYGEKYDLLRIKAGQRYQPQEVSIPKDWSSANYLLAASVILNRKIVINQIDLRSNPGESEFISILKRMGCRVSVGSGSVSILHSGNLNGVEIDMKDSPDSVLTLLAVALFARGTTTVKNISHLIHKESDRIKQVEKELKKIGADIKTTEDSITVVGQSALHAAVVESHNDHRLAMCLGLISMRNRAMTIVDMGCVRKSFPEFWECMNTIDEGGEECLEIQ